ncbi:hypothetical protein GCM10010923_13750 [Blastomonas marina]|uniref:Uncharacterized protein n=1 Tax=Blastomonas marina TaxID=1867408 RepID=A0ABQ1FBZ6_9SPHN|nr:hypothetical protein GCM10010923_13750 [Blastomonas marina]
MRGGGLIARYAATGAPPPEYTFAIDRARTSRLLIVPPLFDEMNKMRRLLVETMRRLDRADIDSFLIDLPGTNESTAELDRQDAEGWQGAASAAAEHFRATHVLGVRGGAMFVPVDLPGLLYAPVAGAQTLNRMLRSRTIAAREAGREENATVLLERGLRDGIDLAGYRLGASMIAALTQRHVPVRPGLATIDRDAVGGGGMWLRAEPGDAPEQADALAAIVARELTA